MKIAAALMTVGLLLAACSDSGAQTKASKSATKAPPAVEATGAATVAPTPSRAPVEAAPAPAECASTRNPHTGKLEPLEVVTGSGPIRFQVEVAKNDAEREYGLMCRTSVAADRGMLFEFEGSKPRAFWMHNTLVPLDIIFLAADGRVVSIGRNARPLDDSPVPSGAPAVGVLELAGGRAAEIGLLPGDQVKHPFFKP